MSEAADPLVSHISSLTDESPSEASESTENPAVITETPTVGGIEEMSKPREASETVEAEDGESEDPKPEESQDPEKVELKRAADGRLNELINLRREMSETKRNMEEMRRIVLEATEPEPEDELAKDIATYGEDAVNHPSVRLLTDRMNNLRDELKPKSVPPEQQAMIEEAKTVLQNTAVSVQEFQKSQPKYAEAYNYAREQRGKMYAHLPPAEREAQLNIDELNFARSAINQGLDPATEVWKLATGLGYQESQKPKVTSNDVDKMRAGVKSSNTEQLTGTSASRGDVVTLAVYKTLPRSQKMRIAGNQEKWEELVRHGSTTFD